MTNTPEGPRISSFHPRGDEGRKRGVVVESGRGRHLEKKEKKGGNNLKLKTVVALGSVASIGALYMVSCGGGDDGSHLTPEQQAVANFVPTSGLDCDKPVVTVGEDVTANFLFSVKDKSGKPAVVKWRMPDSATPVPPSISEKGSFGVAACASLADMRQAVSVNGNRNRITVDMGGVQALPVYREGDVKVSPPFASWDDMVLPSSDQLDPVSVTAVNDSLKKFSTDPASQLRATNTLRRDTLELLEGSNKYKATRASIGQAVMKIVLDQVRAQAKKQGVDDKTPIVAIDGSRPKRLVDSFVARNPDSRSPKDGVYILSEDGTQVKLSIEVLKGDSSK